MIYVVMVCDHDQRYKEKKRDSFVPSHSVGVQGPRGARKRLLGKLLDEGVAGRSVGDGVVAVVLGLCRLELVHEVGGEAVALVVGVVEAFFHDFDHGRVLACGGKPRYVSQLGNISKKMMKGKGEGRWWDVHQ